MLNNFILFIYLDVRYDKTQTTLGSISNIPSSNTLDPTIMPDVVLNEVALHAQEVEQGVLS